MMLRRSFLLSSMAFTAFPLSLPPSVKSQVLRRARELITDKRNWITRKAFVIPRGGAKISELTQLSVYGAIYRAGYELTRYRSYTVVNGKTYPITEFLRPKDFFTDAQLIKLCDINDNHGHRATLAHLDNLIQEA
jgi:hypothetical protein